MYMRVWDILKIANDPSESRPLILCEYAISCAFHLTVMFASYFHYCSVIKSLISVRYSHAMGNSNGNVHAYWEAINETFGLQGGFIWDWADQVNGDYFILIFSFLLSLMMCFTQLLLEETLLLNLSSECFIFLVN